MRKLNNATITALAAKTSPQMQWKGVFKQLVNTAVEAGFADQRTYFHGKDEIDKQVHLGFDLASTIGGAGAGVEPRDVIVHADYLGIYGNCVIVDHGMGLQSLYAHLSSIDVKVGDRWSSDRRWAAAARPDWPAAIICTSRCCSAATP